MKRSGKKLQAKLGDRVQLGERFGIVAQRRLGHAAVMWDDGSQSVCEIAKLHVVMPAKEVMIAASTKLAALKAGQ